ncbi:MAG: nicotinic acid mononucleotide adenylyltransferase, partial [Pusillimonas sp.]
AISGRLTTDPQGIRATHAGRVVLMPITPLEISATRVRELLAAGQQPRYLLPVELLDSPTLLAPYRR